MPRPLRSPRRQRSKQRKRHTRARPRRFRPVSRDRAHTCVRVARPKSNFSVRECAMIIIFSIRSYFTASETSVNKSFNVCNARPILTCLYTYIIYIIYTVVGVTTETENRVHAHSQRLKYYYVKAVSTSVSDNNNNVRTYRKKWFFLYDSLRLSHRSRPYSKPNDGRTNAEGKPKCRERVAVVV